MSRCINFDTDFKQFNEAAEWVRNLLRDHGGIYLTETDGILSIWLINPKVLLGLPSDVASVIADTIDRLTADTIPKAAVTKRLSNQFIGARTSVSTIQQIQSAMHRQLIEQVDLTTVYHQLETALVHALYDFAESR